MIRRIKSELIHGLWLLRAATGTQKGVGYFSEGQRLVVSLTAIPTRIPRLHITIETLLRQSRKPDRIILWLSDELKHRRMPWLLRKQMRRGLTLRFCEDVGPHTKIHYALKEFPDDILVTCDDDRIYGKDWLKGLYEAHQKDPQSIMCYRAHEILLDEKGALKKYTDWRHYAPGFTGPSHRLFATGVGGVLYPPGSLHGNVLDKELFSRLCPKADDVWLKAMAMLQGTPHRRVRPFFKDSEFPIVKGSQEVRLWWDNTWGGRNDEQIKAVLDHFQLQEFFRAEK